MNPAEHRALAETLAARVYQDTVDPQTLAQLAVVHALLGTGPTDLQPIMASPRRTMNRDSWVVLLLLLGTIVAVVALVAT